MMATNQDDQLGEIYPRSQFGAVMDVDVMVCGHHGIGPDIHCESKNMPPYFCPYLRQILTDFKNSFTGTLCGKFAMKWLLIIPPHLKSVATLPCETLMSVKLAIAAVSLCAQRLFGHFGKFRQRSQQMIRTTVDCDLSLWIPDALNDVFVADLPSLIPVY